MSGLQTLSVRVGQLCGGDNGSWRPEEWFPRVLFSSEHLGTLPTNDRHVNGMATSTAANAYVNLIKESASITKHQIVHLVHPRPIRWNDLMLIIGQELDMPLIPFGESFKALHVLKDESNDLKALMKRSPLIRIMHYAKPFLTYTSRTPYVDCPAVPLLGVANALRLSPTLRDPAIRRINADFVRSWLKHLGIARANTGSESNIARPQVSSP
ncbi:hypothetical protein BKA70DRAFT_1434358 [Coprinopsis sp. MPI-PUGE-AT-0042]|nr:hypothetical protein BKA70DRAFT_1434358 [Coprinopsis sp. MPI-PUGE-AT-0042]